MDYRTKAINCVKDTVLPVIMQWFRESDCDLDIYCQKYGETEFSYAKVICPEALAGGKEASFCECSRQSMIYVLENMMPEKHIEVEIIETVLSGGEKCRFRVSVE